MTIFNDTYFDPYQTENYILSGQVDLTGFSFALTDNNGACKTLKSYTFPRAVLSYDDWAHELDLLFRKEPLLKKKYRLSSWIFFSNKSTLIPNNFFDLSQLRTCLEYASGIDELDEVHHRTLAGSDIICVYAIPSPPANIVLKYQPASRFFHQQEGLLLLFEKFQEKNRILLNITPLWADILIYADGKLLLSNTYPVKAFTDVLYNLVLATKACNLRVDDFSLFYAGQLDSTSENLLHCYFKNAQKLYDKTVRLHIGEQNATIYYSLLSFPYANN